MRQSILELSADCRTLESGGITFVVMYVGVVAQVLMRRYVPSRASSVIFTAHLDLMNVRSVVTRPISIPCCCSQPLRKLSCHLMFESMMVPYIKLQS